MSKTTDRVIDSMNLTDVQKNTAMHAIARANKGEWLVSEVSQFIKEDDDQIRLAMLDFAGSEIERICSVYDAASEQDIA